MAGFHNGSILVADNVDFSGAYPPTNQVTADGELLIGATAAPNVRVGTLTSTGATVTITAGAGTINLETAGGGGGQPITDYVVDPDGGGDYTTIQDAMDQANTDGGGSVWVRPGAYAESLTFYGDVSLVGASATGDTAGLGAVVTGSHAPPTSGFLEIRNMGFQDNAAASIITSAAAGTTVIHIIDCWVETTASNFPFLSIANWTGDINIIGLQSGTTGYQVLNNTTGSSDVVLQDCEFVVDPTQTASIAGAGTWIVQGCVGGSFNNSNAAGIIYILHCSEPTVNCSGATSEVYVHETYFSYPPLANDGIFVLYNCTVVVTVEQNVVGTLTAYNCHFEGVGAGISPLVPFNASAIVNLHNCTLIPGTAGGDAIGYVAGPASTVNLDSCVFPIGALVNAAHNVLYIGSVKGGGFGWEIETGAAANMVSNWGYIANRATAVTLTLPLTADVGDIIKIAGKGAGNWIVAQNAAQTIHNVAATSTTGVGGTLSPTEPEATVEMVCITKTTDWQILSFTGTMVLV